MRYSAQDVKIWVDSLHHSIDIQNCPTFEHYIKRYLQGLTLNISSCHIIYIYNPQKHI